MILPIDRPWSTRLFDTLSKYAYIPEEERNRLLTQLVPLKLKRGEFFVYAGDIPDTLAFIVWGIFRVFYTTESGEEKTLVFREENRLLSAYSSFLENIPSKFSIQALEDSSLIYISLKNYETLLLCHPCWQTINAKYAQLLFIEKEKRENEFLTEDAETRYNNFICKYPDLEKRINQYHIASYLGITPVALSRIRKKKSHSN